MITNEDPAQSVIRYIQEAHKALSRAGAQLVLPPLIGRNRSKNERELQRALYRAHIAAASASIAMAGRHLDKYPDLHAMHKAVVTDVTELKTNKLVDNGALIHPILESRMVGNLVCKLVTYISMAARQPVYSPPEPTWHFPTPIV